jgi:type IV secretion system protein VirB6
MNFNITTLLAQVDRFGENYVAQAYQNLASALTGGGQGGVAGLLLTLYVIVWAFGIWQGTAQGTPVEITGRLLRAFAIYTLATQWPEFQTFVYRLVNEGPSSIGNALLTSTSANVTGTSAGLNSVNGVQVGLQNMWNSLASSTSAFIKNLGVLNPGGYILGMLILVAGALLIGYAVFLIVLAKIFLWLLLAVAPIFIVLLLFGATNRYFSGWAAAIVQYVVVQILVYAFVAFFISLSQTYFDAINRSNNAFTTSLTEAAPLILICVIGVLLLSQITNVAANIAGGVGIGTPGIGRFYARAIALGAAGGGRWAARKAIDRTGIILPPERAAGRARARIQHAQRQFEQTAEYRRLARTLTET